MITVGLTTYEQKKIEQVAKKLAQFHEEGSQMLRNTVAGLFAEAAAIKAFNDHMRSAERIYFNGHYNSHGGDGGFDFVWNNMTFDAKLIAKGSELPASRARASSAQLIILVTPSRGAHVFDVHGYFPRSRLDGSLGDKALTVGILKPLWDLKRMFRDKFTEERPKRFKRNPINYNVSSLFKCGELEFSIEGDPT